MPEQTTYKIATIPQKYLEKILKLQQDQDKSRQKEYEESLEELKNITGLLTQLNSFIGTNINIAKTKRSIAYHSGAVEVQTALLNKPSNPDNYTVIVDIYAQNSSRPIQQMTLINDGPGDLYFIVSQSKDVFSQNEGLLHPNDIRMLFNVYEVRLRVTQPLTVFRLLEGEMRTGSFSPTSKANVEIRLSIQTNEKIKFFDALFDINVPDITIKLPAVQTLFANYGIVSYMPPLPPGQTATLVDTESGLSMPYLIPTGYILEAFDFTGNLSTDSTIRVYLEPIVNSKAIFGQTIFSLRSTLTLANRGPTINLVSNLNAYSTVGIDPTGAPAPGRYTLFTITNDDPFYNTIGNVFFRAVIRKLS